jgi:D-alanine-D-alanine ligase
MENKIHLAVLFGGRSCEHEVSVTSARSVLKALDKDKYHVIMIGISKEGRWLVADDARKVLDAGVVQGEDLSPVALDYLGGGQIISAGPSRTAKGTRIDVFFPLLHGPFGEDGTMQGLLELAGVAYVGSGVVGSAVGMDKEMMKRAFRAEGLPQVDYCVVRRREWEEDPQLVQHRVEARLDYPVFIKPVNLGSSVGVSRAASGEEFCEGMTEAAAYDRKIIIEAEAANCHEIECAVLGNERPEASVLGEIVPGNAFYDYKAKYVDDSSQLIVPARLSSETTERVRALALQAFRAIDAAGLARVDFFVDKGDQTIYLNEINTIPGFTPISMYPRLWEASGVGYSELIDRLIELALERHRENQETQTAL